MRLLFVADGRSPIALNWIQYFTQSGHEVHLASTYSCRPELSLASLNIIPVAFSAAAGEIRPHTGETNAHKKSLIRRLTTPRLRTVLRQWFGPLTLARAGRRLQTLISALQPDLIHAMRIPYEGMLAAPTQRSGIPLVISVWGNDFTLHAKSTPLMARLTRRTLQNADALHTDCHRDMRLAQAWGFASPKPGLTVPGNGGIDLAIFYPPSERQMLKDSPSPSPPPDLQVIHPRGFRAYVRNDTFFAAIPLVLEKHPQTRFLLPTMAGDPHAIPYQNWLDANHLGYAVDFLPSLSRPELANLFRQAALVVSPTEHDGTPNSLLEAMACGCLPIAGDIEALREWIMPGENGLLFDPANPPALAAAILQGLENGEFRQQAATKNARLVADRAEYWTSMAKVEQFYTML